MIPTIPDDQLLTLVARGDAEAFALLFRRRQGDVYRFALHMTASPSIADDVTQETFLSVMRDAGKYDAARATVAAWLCGIARNHVRRRLDRDRRLRPFAEADDDEAQAADDLIAADQDPLGDLTRAERIEELRHAILTLPIAYREALVLCDLQELSYVDAATALGCALGTVRSRLHRGRALLARKLMGGEQTVAAQNEQRSGASESDLHDPRDPRPRSAVTRTERTIRSLRNLA
ncbi:MAG TPA: sigma-70 family RNA polymerase sigma factor [Vicinamibacterales bacterium]|jgi:RNA polymerase sigma-70 factor (ECF subfamily)